MVDLTVRALGDHVLAFDFLDEYARSKPSLLVPAPPPATAHATAAGAERWVIQTGALYAVVDGTAPARIRVYNRETDVDPLCDLRAAGPDGASVHIDRGYALYGVGGNNVDRELDRRGKTYRVHHRETGQGNNHFPWVLSAQGFGLFFDTTFPLTIDLRDRFEVAGSHIRTVYFVAGPTPAEALQRYVQLTGLPPMHPAWALGYEQSSRTWMNPGELDFVTTYFREKHIPCDGFVLLSTYGGQGAVGQHARGFHAGYLDMYQGWNVKGDYQAYNPRLLPGGRADIAELKARGFHPIVHGYWAADYSDPESTERVWQDHRYLAEDGFEGWWLDGTERVSMPWAGIVSPTHIPARWREEPPSQAFCDEYDNVWALLRARAFYEKQRRDFPDRRVYILNRTAFSGMQRYAAGVNQGDFWSSWELFRIQTVWLLSMGMSGVMFPESDIGGHFPTEELTDELYIRWAFLNVFAPLMRAHGHNWRCRLPWGFGPEHESRLVPLIRLRSAMFPYNYSLLAGANQTGLPMMRALALEFPDDLEARTVWDEFLWGPSVLACPTYRQGARSREVYLPAGTWLDARTFRPVSGPTRIQVDSPLGADPWFVRGGAILPTRAPTDFIPTTGDSRLTLLLVPADGGGEFTLYDDDRTTYRYEQGEHSRQRFELRPLADTGDWSLAIGPVVGDHAGLVRERAFTIEAPLALVAVQRVTLDGVELDRVPAESELPSECWWALADRVVIRVGPGAGPRVVVFGPNRQP